jgi:hypothetical protein
VRLKAVALVVILAAAIGGRAAEPAAPADLPQGIKGQVLKLVGDFTLDPPQGERKPISVPVHIFRGRVKSIEKPDLKHPALLRVVQPGTDGRFEVSLLPGEYTVVAEIGGRLYLNNWLDDGSWATVTVKPGKWTNYIIEDVLEATF